MIAMIYARSPYIKCMLWLFALLVLSGCDMGVDVSISPPYEPPPNEAAIQVSRVAIESLAWIGDYAFAAGGDRLIVDGIATTHKIPDLPAERLLSRHSATLMVLTWPALDPLWRYEHDGDMFSDAHPYAYSWARDNREVWISWTPAGRVTLLDLDDGTLTDLGLYHIGILPSSDGTRLIGWGKLESDSSNPRGYAAVGMDNIYIYELAEQGVNLEREIPFSGSNTITGIWGQVSEGNLWVSAADNCDWLVFAGQFQYPCRGQSLWRWDLATDTFSLYWESYTTDSLRVQAFDRARQMLLGTDLENNLEVLDIGKRCVVLELPGWDWGMPAWYGTDSIVQVLNKTDNSPPELAIYRLEPLANGAVPTCLTVPSAVR